MKKFFCFFCVLVVFSFCIFAEGMNETVCGASVVRDEESPSGYTVKFSFDPRNGQDGKTIESVSVWGHFLYVDPSRDIHEAGNVYTPHEYKNGMYPTMYAPNGAAYPDGKNGYTEEMVFNSTTGCYELSFPITSGGFVYQYKIKYVGEEKPVSIDDPVNQSEEDDIPSLSPGGSSIKSVVYGHFDSVKQSNSPNYDFVLPSENLGGDFSYVSYAGNLGTEYLGIYLPPGYNPQSKEPYKLILVSHGGGGNELEWFCYGHVNNIMDNLIASGEAEKAIVVSMDNQCYKWDFANIEDNIINNILPYLEENYNISKAAKDRAFCGLSMGGKLTTYMLFDHTEKFGYYGVFSGTDPEPIREKEGLSVPKVLIVTGDLDFATETIDVSPSFNAEVLIRWAKEHNLSNFVDAGFVKGAHDWFTWPQTFKLFVTEYCWK